MKKLSFLDKYLSAWILIATSAGVALGNFFPGAGAFLDQYRVGSVSLSIAKGIERHEAATVGGVVKWHIL